MFASILCATAQFGGKAKVWTLTQNTATFLCAVIHTAIYMFIHTYVHMCVFVMYSAALQNDAIIILLCKVYQREKYSRTIKLGQNVSCRFRAQHLHPLKSAPKNTSIPMYDNTAATVLVAVKDCPQRVYAHFYVQITIYRFKS